MYTVKPLAEYFLTSEFATVWPFSHFTMDRKSMKADFIE
jgi:hypothetical protein